MIDSDLDITAIGISDVGSTRTNNEDVWVTLPEIGFFAVADGMGGNNAGEVAAKETIDSLVSSVKNLHKKTTLELITEIRSAIEKANRHVHEMSSQNKSYQGMGTTLCLLMRTKEAIIHAHVGDSRVYRLRNKKLSLLTQDHSLFAKWLATGKLAEKCETPYPYKHVITRAIGGSGKANPEIAVATLQEGDVFFLCSDGLPDVLSLTEMEEILNDTSLLQKSAHELIEKAKIKGGSDNMTIVMVRFENAKNIFR